MLKELADDGWAMAIVIHELGFACQAADDVLFFDDGAIVERGTAAQLFTDPIQERTRRFVDRILRPLED